MRLLAASLLICVLLVPASASADVSAAARLTQSTTFSGLTLAHINLFPTLAKTIRPLALPELERPDPLGWIAQIRPSVMLRTQFGTMTSDEHRMRRFAGLTGHVQGSAFESVQPMMMLRLIGLFDAL